MTYEGGIAGTSGLIYTGLGPYDIQSGSTLSFGRANYNRNAFRASFFVNALDANAPKRILVGLQSQRKRRRYMKR